MSSSPNEGSAMRPQGNPSQPISDLQNASATPPSGDVCPIPPDKRVGWIWSEMHRRRSQGESVSANDYLTPFYLAGLTDEGEVDIIYAEYVLREQYEGPPAAEEFIQRYPRYAEALRRQLDLHEALSMPDDETELYQGNPQPAPIVESDQPLPERIGRYVVVSHLGSGSQSDVFRALHPTLECEVVIKLAKHPLNQTPDDSPHISDEAKLLASLSHPNLVRVFDLGIHEDRPFIAMEFVRGRTLQQWARSERPSPQQSAAIVAKIGQALSTAHGKGIVHLDIKPINILIDEHGEPKLIDFGLSWLQDAWKVEDVIDGKIFGTFAYMPPEQARGEVNSLDPRSDIFSLGGVLYFLLTGKAPYPMRDQYAAWMACQTAEWDRAPLYQSTIPPRLARVCEQAMSANPDDRFPNASALVQHLEQKNSQHGWLAVAAITAVLLLTAGLSAWGLWPRDMQSGDKNGEEKVATIEPALDVQVWDTERSYRLAEVVPLRNGDRVRVEAKLPADSYGSLFLVSSDGKVELLRQLEPAGKPRLLSFPEKTSEVVPLVGPNGTELILFCARRRGPIDLEEFESLWTSGDEWPSLPGMTVLRLNPEGVHVEQRDKGFGSPIDREDPESVVQERLNGLQKQLAEKMETFEGIAFTHGK
ncbi:serine/threonine-protein kinase [Blastopirellula sp. JC732]|uniref:Serine/threonine-protein kinase n=1 Tax=Blastopirellula sediminis TaxID=2894196 RepID=A0A9X1MHR9_9BACT|nr:serine/threonine-protein kinase [Blastopirellula sediminis]MCC9608018.1 serine/threonine-protein kinase [Blastopirellula sediminis]MCC9627189.1 serine/threonine-protein kinase [Blastopirellula sediminis]